MATITDVARAAGVSTATVSRTLSNPEVVSEATRDRVRRAVADLGYSLNGAAKSLRTARSMRIILSLPDVTNPFFSSIIRGAEEVAQRAGYSILVGDTHYDSEKEEYFAAMLSRRDADGIIFLGHRLAPSAANLVTRLGKQAPVVNGCEFRPELDVPSVHIENSVAAAETMQHLYDLGHRRIGVITGPMFSPLSRDRLAGVRAAAAGRGMTAELIVENGDFTIETGEAISLRMLTSPSRPSAIFCFSDEMAIGALMGVRRAGLACPGDVSVMGFDDIRYARTTYPPLTTIRQPMFEIGRKTVRILIDILEKRTADPQSETLPHELIVRGSTGPAH
jgi:LacI family transcriptional regulator, repressor for deo operon, udp, cdd, tsx, nupC, and nupG